jgi:hypothetical protein
MFGVQRDLTYLANNILRYPLRPNASVLHMAVRTLTLSARTVDLPNAMRKDRR